MTRRPALILCLVFAAGIWVEGAGGPVPLLFIVMGSWAVLVLALHLRRKPFGAALIGMAFFCGAFAGWDQGVIPADSIAADLDRIKGREVEVVCRVASALERREQGLAAKAVFSCELERVNGYPRRGKVLVNLFGDGDFAYGQRLALAGKVSRPFERFSGGKMSYRAYLARQGIYALVHVRKTGLRKRLGMSQALDAGGIVLAARLRLQEIFFKYLSPGEAGLMNAMLLGPRQDIAPHVYDIFRKTGTAHIIAISGMNMTLTSVGVVFFLGLFRIGRAPRAILAVVILGFYSFMAGNSAPVARSAVMAGVVILSFVMERETDALNNLGLAGLLLLAADPGQLGDVGCQLSFVCVAALILLAPMLLAPFEELGSRQKPLVWFLTESAVVTLAAFIGSAGILAHVFGYLTPVGLIVNLPVIPLMALVTALGAAVLVAGATLPFLAPFFALCLKVVLNISIGGLALASRAPVVDCSHMPAWSTGVYYAALVLAAWFFRRPAARGVFIDKAMPL